MGTLTKEKRKTIQTMATLPTSREDSETVFEPGFLDMRRRLQDPRQQHTLFVSSNTSKDLVEKHWSFDYPSEWARVERSRIPGRGRVLVATRDTPAGTTVLRDPCVFQYKQGTTVQHFSSYRLRTKFGHI